MTKLDVCNVEILVMLFTDNPTISEIAERVGRSVGGVHERLEDLEKQALVNPPRKKGAARDRQVTEKGELYLIENGYLPTRVWRD